MTYFRKLTVLGVVVAVATITAHFATDAGADPLPGQVLKFVQEPMIATPVGGAVYHGHDELSTLYGISNFGNPFPSVFNTHFVGTTMADDFADPFDTPVVHVRWWGSYIGNFQDPNNAPLDRFLIAFESDLPANQNPLGFSRPDQVLSTQIVDRGPLAPGSGTFTEKLIFAVPGGEDIYEYNAELHFDKPFPQDPNTVYWIKIAALMDVVDINGDGTINLSDLSAMPQWGWHNRDYTVPNPFALAVTPPILPGERDEAVELGLPYPTEVWHFQDDAVSNTDTEMFLDPTMPNMPTLLDQNPFAFFPERYVDGLDGPGGLPPNVGVSSFSKDLAFELYTIPEPATCMLMLLGLGTILVSRGRLTEMS